jgi:hypothetical protein
MLNEYANSPWQDMKHKGYVHVRKFLTDAELELLRNDWHERAKVIKGSKNDNHPIVDVPQGIIWRFHRKLKAVTEAVHAATGINADADAGGCAYYATAKGINFAWHQDYEPYFVYQQFMEYLNFYIPIVKPDPKRTNLCLISMDHLQAHLPERSAEYVGSGAKCFYIEGDQTRVCYDHGSLEYMLPVNFEEIKVTPELEAGDLLLLRGDVIHRTQDTDTERVSVAFRRTNSSAVISKEKLLAAYAVNREMMHKNWNLYEGLFECFNELKQDEVTARQFHSYVMKRAGV